MARVSHRGTMRPNPVRPRKRQRWAGDVLRKRPLFGECDAYRTQSGTHRSRLCLLQIDAYCLGLADLDGRRQGRDRVEGLNLDLQMSYSRTVTS